VDRQFVLRRDGERITGHRRGSGDRVVILTHEIRGTPCDLAALGASLVDAGYRVVSWTTESGATTRGLRGLVEHERAAGARYVALVGASMGGATSIVASGATRPPVDAVVALSPPDFADDEGDVRRSAGRFAGPLMVVAGEFDSSFADVPMELAEVHDGVEVMEVVEGSSDHGKYFAYRRTDPWVAPIIDFLGR
jgi:dienelactone hydrolase